MNISLLTFGRIVQFCELSGREIEYVNLDEFAFIALYNGIKGKKFCDVLSNDGTTMIVKYGKLEFKIVSRNWKTLPGTRNCFHTLVTDRDDYLIVGPIVKLI